MFIGKFMPNIEPQVATVILAGGQGKRLHPLTIHHSKPAVSYGGRYRLIDIPISNSLNSHFRQIFVIAQYLTAELHHHINQTYRFDPYHPGSIDLITPEENEKGEKNWFEGTADAVRKSLPTLLKSTADYFLILSGDQLYNIDFQKMVAFAKSQDADLTIASIPVSEKEAHRLGLLKVDTQARVIDFVEKPQDPALLKAFQYEKPRQFLGSMGIYVFKRESLIALLEQDQRPDFGYHLITTAVKTKKTAAFVYTGYWEDIGTIASYHQANLMLTSPKCGLETYDEKNPIYTRPTFLPGPRISRAKIDESIICEGCVIEAEEVSRSIIGLRTQIKKGTIIRDTVLMGNHFYPPSLSSKPTDSWIGENCLIEKAIIDEHVQIGHNVKLTNQKKYETYDGEGIFVRDGIIIIPSGAKIPDSFEF
jgi:glucose-1-phosphate adenylyltransferase